METDSETEYHIDSDGENIGPDTSKNYTIHKVSTKISQKYSVLENTFKVHFNPDTHGENILDMRDDLHQAFGEVLAETAGYSDNDKARIIINHDQLANPIFIHCQPRHQITADTIMER